MPVNLARYAKGYALPGPVSGEVTNAGFSGVQVQRAGFLTQVTPEDPISHERSEFLGD